MIVKNGAPFPTPNDIESSVDITYMYGYIYRYMYIIFKGKYITQFKCPIPSSYKTP